MENTQQQQPIAVVQHQGDFDIADWMLKEVYVDLTPKAHLVNELMEQARVTFDQALHIADSYFTADGMRKLVVLLVIVLAGIRGLGQTLGDAPQPKFLDKETKLELAMSAAAISFDAYTTFRNVRPHEDPSLELNPLARPFIRTPGGTAAYFGAAYAGEIGTMYLFRRHRWIKRGIALGVTAGEIGWGIFNITTVAPRRPAR
jgi:hypothetical protein